VASQPDHPHHHAPKIALGVALLGAVVFVSAADRGHPWILCLGSLMLVASMVLSGAHWTISEVRRVNRPADDAFSEGYEAGFDRGWRERDSEVKPNLVALPGLSASPENADSCGEQPQLPAERASNT
jgi:hypothetical protein